MDLPKVPEEQRAKLEQLEQSLKEHQQQKQQELEQKQLQNLQFQQQQQQVYQQQQYGNNNNNIQYDYHAGYVNQYDYHHIRSQSQSHYVIGSQSYDQSSQAYYDAYYHQQQQQHGRGQEGVVNNQGYAGHHVFAAVQQCNAGGRHLGQGQGQMIEPARFDAQGVSVSQAGEIRSDGVLVGGEKANAGYREQGVVKGRTVGYMGATQPQYLGDIHTGANSVQGCLRGGFGGHHVIPAGRGSRRGFFRGRGCSWTGHSQFAEHGTPSFQNTQPSVAWQALQYGVPQEVTPRNAALAKWPSQVFKCQICNVECNRMELLEQHKVGKKHMKNLQKMGMLKKDAFSSAAGMMNGQEPTSSSNMATSSQQAILPHVGERQSMSEAASESGKVPKQSDFRPEPNATVVQNGKKKGVKRKLMTGAGGKRLKGDPHKPPVVAPVVCEICNIWCDTEEVFNIHLSGKKHISKAKRYQGHAGPIVPQAIYPPNPTAQNPLPLQPQPLSQTQPQPQPQPQSLPQPYPHHAYVFQ